MFQQQVLLKFFIIQVKNEIIIYTQQIRIKKKNYPCFLISLQLLDINNFLDYIIQILKFGFFHQQLVQFKLHHLVKVFQKNQILLIETKNTNKPNKQQNNQTNKIANKQQKNKQASSQTVKKQTKNQSISKQKAKKVANKQQNNKLTYKKHKNNRCNTKLTMKIDYYIIIFSVLFSKLLCQCLNGEIYNILTQQCLKCSISCQQCFNTNEDNCIKCQTNTFNSIQNNFQCTQTCLQGQINTENQQCVQCLVEGCIQCDANQNCLKCEVNLQLSQENNKCFLKQNFCESSVEFIESPFTKNQCSKICSSFTYQNFETHQCEQTQQCPYFQSSFDNFNQRIVQVNSFLGNQYFIRGNQCQFALVNQNFEIINSNILQNLNNFEELYMQYGVEVNQKSFIVGNYGGCLANNSLVIANFATSQTVYSEIGFQDDLNVGYIDTNNQIVFLISTNYKQIIVFDGISSQIIN
ncbi:hypothetical protein TTHERM_00075940 (macronuclear) [Tetrahymena thermophila SB210]|uniref:Zinc finger protein n=1 Tax=Tetrahymena thermophila (strain SB210) TaxID=312017 RepID=Q23G71_TETTS|nr:hypothetical protein TTHERM_00075940 [Tetrahymena thermophila SB210]EAR95389.2 hypothetical protein TTHERM_00075940 [Tetrahymena thermophila SB210]|eukprot:XP_001015634.2 hypothetical protein TTHERM_00075940 [Tetrahymena thermophila SB210]